MKRIFAFLIAAVFLAALPAGAAGKRAGTAAVSSSEAYTLEPSVSEGVTVSEDEEGSMTVMAHEENGLLVFDETKALSFTAVYGEGWLVCDRYSHFFDGDSRASKVEIEPGTVQYGFSVSEGGSVSMDEWRSVTVNASASELPKLRIDAEESFENIDRETWVNASFTITLGTKEFESGDYEGTGSVKGRGNSSWTRPKKPYSIKLSSKASLLDIPKTKKYAIIPSYDDGSLMRNYITYKIWQGLVGIDYVPKCEFVDVYLNGVYNGIYILVERIDIESNKIDIDEADAEHLSGGYLIEKDIDSKFDFDNDLWFNCPYWANQAQDYFVLKTPEPDDEALTALMLEYLESYMQSVHAAIMGESPESWQQYVDVSSWIDFVILQEVAKNIDGNLKTSCFMIKERDDDKLYMTAPWDFDFAYGRVDWNNQSPEHNAVADCPPANTVDGFMVVNSSNPWMDKLYDTVPEFRAALMERYALYRGTLIEDMFRMIDEQAAYLTVVQEPNYELWHKGFHVGVTALRTWLSGRIGWLDGEWLEHETVWALGDVNMDGSVTVEDALLVLRGAMSLVSLGEAEPLADCDGDGEVTPADALLILRTAMGLISAPGPDPTAEPTPIADPEPGASPEPEPPVPTPDPGETP